jgi:single-strand DNA-binding protein
MSVNSCTFIGYAGSDPVAKYLPDGTAVCNFSIACNEQWKDKSGAKQEKTEWIRLGFFGKVAEIAVKYVRKGSQIYVQGRMQTRDWEKDGVKHYMTEVNVRELKLLEPKARDDAPALATTRHDAPALATPRSAAPKPDPFEDDIPF